MFKFEDLNTYGKWSEVSRESLSESVKNSIERTEVIPGDFGKTACFYMHGGNYKLIPLSRDCELGVGDTLDLDNGQVITIKKDNQERYRWMQ